MLALLQRALYAALVALGAYAGAQAPAQFAMTTVGSAAAPQAVTLTVGRTGLASGVEVSTQGLADADFAIAAGGTCSGSTTYLAGQSCTVDVVFQPRYPGRRTGVALLRGSDGSVLGSALLSGMAQGSLAVLRPGRIDTVAGTTAWLYRGDGVAATSAPIFLPSGLAGDAAGNLYISDSANNRVRRVEAATGLITTIAGNGSPGYGGDGGPAAQAMISNPAALALDGAGDVYFVDSGNHCVRRVDAFTGVITTVAGVGVQGYSGDGTAATAAKLSLPEGLAFDAAGNLYIADTGNDVVRVVDAASGVIRTLAGTGTGGFNGDGRQAATAMLNQPRSVAFGPDGLLYIADLGNNRVRRVDSTGLIATAAGTGAAAFDGDDAAAAQSALNAPADIAFDPAGNLYIADSANNRVRRVDVATGKMSTVTGTGSEGFGGDTGPADRATVYGPNALLFDQAGNLSVADMFHNRVRRISASSLVMIFDTIRVGKVSLPRGEGLENDGNGAMTIGAPVLTHAALDTASTTCSSVLAPGAGCVLGVEFAPTVVSSLLQGSVAAVSDAADGAAVVTVYGQVLTVEPTSVTLTSSANPSLLNAPVTLTATVSSADTNRSGGVTFRDGTAVLCGRVSLRGDGTALCTVQAPLTLSLGVHAIVAGYEGDPNNAASDSPVLTQVVKQNAALALVVTPSPAVVKSVVTLTATASAGSGVPSGTVTFYDGAIALGTAALDGAGVAVYSTARLRAGMHSLSAVYAGDATNSNSTSAAVSETIAQAATVTTLASSAASVVVGATVNFTVTVVSTNGPTPTGTVTLTDAGTAMGAGALDGNGVATVSVTTLATGVHSVVASYGGDDDDAVSVSAGLTESVLPLGTVTLLASDANPANAGAVIHLSATVSLTPGAVAQGSIGGRVTFAEGGITLGSGVVGSNGVASLDIATLGVGQHGIVATFGGSTNYAGSASASLVQVVHQTSTATALSVIGTGLVGQPLTLTAVVTSVSGLPTGTVIFYDGGAALGQATLNAQATATLPAGTLGVGTHSITAVYVGNADYSTSTSSAWLQTIRLAEMTVALSGPVRIDAGTTAMFAVTLAGEGGAPAGSVTLRDGGTVIGVKAVSGAGTFNFSATLAIGSHTLSASYGGDAEHAPGVSNTMIVTVAAAASAVALQSDASPQIVGQAVTLTASVTSTSANLSGSVSFQDGGVVIGSAAVGANGVAALSVSTLGFGAHAIVAVYSGDANHLAASSAPLTQAIVQAAQVALGVSANPSPSGAAVVFTARVSTAAAMMPTGRVAFRDGGATLGSAVLDASGAASLSTAGLAVGTHTVTAAYGGDANLAAATSTPLLQTVQNASTQVTLSGSASVATYATAVTFTVAVTSNGGVATGDVSFADGGLVLGSAVLGANGVGMLTTASLTPGAHTVVATYMGDGRAGASVSTPLGLSVKQTTVVALASNANPAQTLSAVVLTATVGNAGATAPGGTVVFSDGAVQIGVAALDASGRASFTAPSMSAGSHAVVASYAGDGADFAAVSGPLAQAITLRPTSTALTATASNPADEKQVTLIAVVRWTGTSAPAGVVTFTTGTTVVGTAALDATGVGTLNIFVQSGSEQIVATYGGDTAYAASNSVATAISGGAATQFTALLAPAALTMVSKQHGLTTLTLTSVKGFADTMQFGCAGLPFAATCTFDRTSAKLAANGTVTVQLTVDTGNPLGAGAQARAASRKTAVMVCFAPGALVLAMLGWRRRRKLPILLLLAVMLGSFGMTGCSGLTEAGTPAGTYSFQVTARGQGTGAAQSQTLTLTVTP